MIVKKRRSALCRPHHCKNHKNHQRKGNAIGRNKRQEGVGKVEPGEKVDQGKGGQKGVGVISHLEEKPGGKGKAGEWR